MPETGSSISGMRLPVFLFILTPCPLPAVLPVLLFMLRPPWKTAAWKTAILEYSHPGRQPPGCSHKRRRACPGRLSQSGKAPGPGRRARSSELRNCNPEEPVRADSAGRTPDSGAAIRERKGGKASFCRATGRRGGECRQKEVTSSILQAAPEEQTGLP